MKVKEKSIHKAKEGNISFCCYAEISLPTKSSTSLICDSIFIWPIILYIVQQFSSTISTTNGRSYKHMESMNQWPIRYLGKFAYLVWGKTIQVWIWYDKTKIDLLLNKENILKTTGVLKMNNMNTLLISWLEGRSYIKKIVSLLHAMSVYIYIPIPPNTLVIKVIMAICIKHLANKWNKLNYFLGHKWAFSLAAVPFYK
jgi:hypothetical protein